MNKLGIFVLMMAYSVIASAHDVVNIGDTMEEMRKIHGIESRVVTVSIQKGNKEFRKSAHY